MLHDADIREPLFDYLEDSYGKIRILEEVQISRSRADVIMVTDDSLVGLEIKSDADTYVRLERQVKDYNLSSIIIMLWLVQLTQSTLMSIYLTVGELFLLS